VNQNAPILWLVPMVRNWRRLQRGPILRKVFDPVFGVQSLSGMEGCTMSKALRSDATRKGL